MAAPKPTRVFSAAFSTFLAPCRIDQVIRQACAVLDRAEQDAQVKRTHGMTRKDWDAALSMHLHGDLR